MNIDERLERLTERTDALAQTVELLAGMHRESDRRVEEVNRETARHFAETLEFINQLAHIAEAHERRLDNLEQP